MQYNWGVGDKSGEYEWVVKDSDALSGETLLHQHCGMGIRIIVQQEKIYFYVQF